MSAREPMSLWDLSLVPWEGRDMEGGIGRALVRIRG